MKILNITVVLLKNVFSQHGRTALHKAAHHGYVSIVESLLNGDLTAAEELARAADKVNSNSKK